jgi:hypothetical protein
MKWHNKMENKIYISPPSALVIQGTNQQIVCTVQGTPAAQSISWTRSGVSIAIDNSKYTGGNTANPVSIGWI